MKNPHLRAWACLSATTCLNFISIHFSHAATDNIVQLQEVVADTPGQTNPAVVQKTHKAIQQEMIADSRDLVRYTTDVGISDNGRHTKGFAMRGVEGNRVGISIDGVSMPDSEENSVYARYGNFNHSRLAIDPELVQGIDIVRGADSFNSGSGSLGGGVNYRTLEAEDIVMPGNHLGVLLKNGYASKNREWVHTGGLGYKDKSWEALLLYSQRRGHELKSRGQGEDISGNARGVPDPASHRNHSYLAKIAYRLNDVNRLSVSFNQQKNKNDTDERSYQLLMSSWRRALDISKRRNFNIAHEYFPEKGSIAYLKTDFDWLSTDLGTINYKGSRHWKTNEKELDEIYDRQLKTTFKRATIRLETHPLDMGLGIHTFSVRSAVSQRDFENLNKSTYFFASRTETTADTIQHPIRSRQLTLSIQDKIVWNAALSTDLGLRYDHTKVKPRKLNAQCYVCDETPLANTFKGLSGQMGLIAHISDTWRASYYLASGFRIPSASEMYFTFKHPAGTWLSNPELKSERSLTHTVSMQGDNALGNININLYQSNYKRFLTEQETAVLERGKHLQLYQQMVNLDKARIRGIELSGSLNLSEIASVPQGWKLGASLGYSKGKLSNGTSLLSIQPMKIIVGLDYEDPQGRWGVFGRLTRLGAKKARDAKVTQHSDYCTQEVEEFDYWYGTSVKRCLTYQVKTETVDYPWLNQAATLADVYGYVKLGKHVTLRGGVYNIFNRKYHTWDALRGINRYSTTNSVDRENKGLERFVAPGRNFAAALEIRY